MKYTFQTRQFENETESQTQSIQTFLLLIEI